MNADGFAQVPDLDNQCNTSSSVAAGSHRLPSARHLQVNEMNNMFSQFTPQASYLGQEGDNPFSQLQPMHSMFLFPHLVSSDDPWFSPKARKTVTLPLTTSHSAFHHSLSLVDTSMRTLPQHLTQGASEINANSFPLTGASPALNMFASIHQPMSGNANQSERPTAAQAAAGRLQRASARQAAKAAQQQKRHAQARAAAKKGAIAGVKRKKDESTHNDDDESDEDCSADAGANEPGMTLKRSHM